MQGKTGECGSRKAVIKTVRKGAKPQPALDYAIFQGDTEQFLASLPSEPLFDLVVTSPPYNIGKSYEKKDALETYMAWQKRIINLIVPRLKPEGSLCWQVGNFVDNGQIVPLDIEFAPIFKGHGLQMRNRIIWHFGHGLHTRRRFSGRYEVVLWYSKTDDYYFDLDAVRVPSKYPGKKHFKGPKKGLVSGNPLGKNPEDVWEDVEDVWNIPNVKSNHVEKTRHPCQFPVGLIERLVGSSQFFRQFRPLNVVDNCARNGWGSTTRCLNVAECGCSRTRHTQRPGP